MTHTTSPTARDPHDPTGDRDKDLFSYELLTQRQGDRDNLLWQTPALAFSAQAFLFTIALDSGSSRLARLVSALLIVVVSLLAMQLMYRHRQLRLENILDAQKVEDEHQLMRVERRREMEGGLRRMFAAIPNFFRNPRNYLRELRSYRVWMAGLSAFMAAAILIGAVTLFWPSYLQEPLPVKSDDSQPLVIQLPDGLVVTSVVPPPTVVTPPSP